MVRETGLDSRHNDAKPRIFRLCYVSRSVAALDRPPDGQFTTAPLQVPSKTLTKAKGHHKMPFCADKNVLIELSHRGINKKSAVTTLDNWEPALPVVRETRLDSRHNDAKPRIFRLCYVSRSVAALDRPPDGQFTTAPLQVPSKTLTKAKRASQDALLLWCEKRDLNPYGKTTRPSNVRVCQFRHSRLFNIWYYTIFSSVCQALFSFF